MSDDFNHPTVMLNNSDIITDQTRSAGSEDYDNDFDGTAYTEKLPIPKPIMAVDIKQTPQPKPNPSFNTVAITIQPGDSPTLLLGTDPRRTSFRINAIPANSVQIGDRSQVQMNLGYVPFTGDTICNAGEFFVATAPGIDAAATVTVLVEYSL